MQNKSHMQTPIGSIIIEENGAAITALYLDKDEDKDEKTTSPQSSSCPQCPQTPLLQEAQKQLNEYFAGTRKKIELPIHLQGTKFQQKVWKALQQIPYGETRSYGEIAASIGNPKASRAIGGANNKNPIMIIVPCHRVIGADGSLVGFGGGLPAKKYLLDLEKSPR